LGKFGENLICISGDVVLNGSFFIELESGGLDPGRGLASGFAAVWAFVSINEKKRNYDLTSFK
jgi:hypothetical protein